MTESCGPGDPCTAPHPINDPCADPDCWRNPMGDPMVEWLAANKVDLMRIVMFPEIDLRGDEMLIEYVYGLEDSPTSRGKLVLRKPATRMVPHRVLVPMPPELWEAYGRARDAYRLDGVLKQLGEAGATVLAAKPGSQIVFVCAEQASPDNDFWEQASVALGEALPGVKVTILAGVNTILHSAPQEGGRE